LVKFWSRSVIMVCLVLIALIMAGCSSPSSPATNTTPSNTTSAPVTSAPAPATSSAPTTTTSAPATSSAPRPVANPAPVFRVGLLGELTSVAAAPVIRLFQEAEYMMKYTNEVEGGISGVKLDWKVVDNKGTADGAVIAYKQIRDSYKPDIYLQVEDYLLLGAIKDIMTDNSNIITTSALVPNIYSPPGRFFSISMPNSDGFGAYINWVAADWKGPGNAKVGVLYWENNPSAEGWMAAKGLAAQKNIELVPVTYDIATLDLKTQLMKLKDSKVNYIWMHSITPNASIAIRDANSLGISRDIKITFMEYVESEDILNQVGAAAEGFYGYGAHSPYSEGAQGAKVYSQIWKFGENKDVWSDNRQVIVLKALLDALVPKIADDIKANSLTSDKVYNALNGLSNIETWGNNKDFGFSPAKRVGISNIKMVKYTPTSTVSASDWITMPRLFEGFDK
jgi:hypothetical protein